MARQTIDSQILFEDNHLLVVDKPAGIATMGDDSGQTVHSLAAEYLRRKYNKPGRAFVGIVSRLDALTSGVIVLAKTSKAAARLTKQFGNAGGPAVAKVYLVAVEGSFPSPEGSLCDYVVKNERAKKMEVVDTPSSAAKRAELNFRTLLRSPSRSVLAVQLLTGRKHQIRVQFASQGYPVLGDRKYGANSRFPVGIALHSWLLRIEHPTLKQAAWYQSDLPESWHRIHRDRETVAAWRTDVSDAFELSLPQATKAAQNEPTFLPRRLVSGGQTGVDRGALDAAIAIGLDHGGWCPAGRLSEDGSIPSCYQLVETDSAEYPVRTEQNVLDSDATLILYRSKLKGGTLLTRKICARVGKPYLVVRVGTDGPELVRRWLSETQPETLNVAGPRESTCHGIQEQTMKFLLAVLAH